MRISVEDKIKQDESESITNQRMLLNDFLNKNTEFKTYIKQEYVDIGYSGTNDKRPAFQNMLEEIKLGNIQVIIVKDLSRFMRDYISLGDYLENIFPFLGIRFIAINDGYDSAKENQNGIDIDVQFRSLLYDFYAKDISKKVKSVTTTLKKQGKFLAWSPPFGYMKDPKDRHKIIVDTETAWIVNKIFNLALEGISSRNIAKLLNEEKIPTPLKRKKEITNMDYNYNVVTSESRNKPTWTNGNVIDILSNENYTGTYVFNMQEKSTIKQGSFKVLPKEKWERVENNHEAIISKEIFEKVQKIRENKKFMNGKNTDYEWRRKSPLQGFAKCPTCNHILACSESKRKTKTKGLRIHRYFFCRICKCNNIKHKNSRVDSLEEQVLSMIKEKYSIIENEPKIKFNIKELEKNIENLNYKKMDNFEKYKFGKISKDKFIESKNCIDNKIKEYEEQIKISEKQKDMVEYNKLTRELMEKYVESVICEGNKILNVVWK